MSLTLTGGGYGSRDYGAGLYGLPLSAEFPGGIPIDTSDELGALALEPGSVQYGPMLVGSGSLAGWYELVGWRDTPDTSVSDTTRPQAHGAYPGDIWAEAATVTYTYRLRGLPIQSAEERLEALRVIEAYLPLDGVERPLVVNDGAARTFRMGRVLQRRIPQPWDFLYSKALECSVQWLCADPRRYSLDQISTVVAAPVSTGGLVYPLAYPLDYGMSQGGSRTVSNDGSTATPITVDFTGPLTDPVLVSDRGWRLGFDIVLAAGETLSVNTAQGTATLDGVDRVYAIATDSSPLERCTLPSGQTALTLAAGAGAGQATITHRHAYL